MEKVWKASWIQDTAFASLRPLDLLHKEVAAVDDLNHPSALQNHHMLVRKKFILTKEQLKLSAFRLDVTADDYYKLYVNGTFIGQGPAQGYHFHYPYNEWNLTEHLVEGDNVIAIHVYYQGLINRVYNSGDLRQGMIAELWAGDDLLLHSDKTWKYTRTERYGQGDTIGYDTQYLENIDSRLDLPGWSKPEFDDESWLNCHEALQDDHDLVRQSTRPVDVYERKPESIKELEQGRYIIDFGQELTGQFNMQASGRKGDTVEIRCGEELDESTGHVRYNLRCNCTYREGWTLSGGLDTLDLFEYKAFRYVEIIDPQQTVLPESFTAIVRHYPFDDHACGLQTSNLLFNQIWSICKHGVKLGAQEHFVDCPTREKGQYLGDNTITTHAHMYLTGDYDLTRKALKDFALAAQHICPGGMAVAPGHFMQEIADFSFQWPMQLWQYYQQSGDTRFLTQMEPIADAMIRYFDSYRRENGLLADVTDKWNLVDWPEGMRDGYDFPLTRPVSLGCHNVINAFYYGALQAVKLIKEALKLPCDDITMRAYEVKEAFISTFYNEDSGLFVDSEHSKHSSLHANALPLCFDLMPPGKAAEADVVRFLKEKRLSCGVYMSYFLLKGLSRVNEYDFIYELLTSEDERSWGNMVKEGATACFEAWGKEQKWNTSLCHPWASAPIPLFIEEIIGLKPNQPGWSEIRFTPHVPAALEAIEFEMNIPAGRIHVSYKDGLWALQAPGSIKVVTA
jgi:alpha-L-rhamnosidase